MEANGKMFLKFYSTLYIISHVEKVELLKLMYLFIYPVTSKQVVEFSMTLINKKSKAIPPFNPR